jgi:DNA-binding IclR family transcriptional regulator
LDNSSEKIIQSVDRAIKILRCFDNYEELGITEISKMLNLHKSTTFGLVSTLHANGILEQNENTGKYKLGLELYRLGTKVNLSLRTIVLPYLERLVEMYEETANLVVMQGLSVVYLEKVESSHSMRISTSVGGRKPLYCTAVGKAILAHLPPDELNRKLDKMELVKFTDNTITCKDELKKALIEIKEKGYAKDNEEMEIGLCCIAAPILNQYGYPIGAISVSGPKSRMNSELDIKVGKVLVEFTMEISKKLGYF